MNRPWAVLLCKMQGNDSEPHPRGYYERLFTRAGAGTQNLSDYFLDMSHQAVDIGDSQIFPAQGWFTHPWSSAEWRRRAASDPNLRSDFFRLALETAVAAGVDLSGFHGVVVCTNDVEADTFGTYATVAVNSVSQTVSTLGHEIGHGFGLVHAGADGSPEDYGDAWDIMASLAYAEHPVYGAIGPGLNAWNMRGRGWLDESRVWHGSRCVSTRITLRPLHRLDLDGFLAAEAGPRFLVEFRLNDRWDARFSRAAVFVHRFEGGRSYVMRGTHGGFELLAGDRFEVGAPGIGTTTVVEVDDIDVRNATASIVIRECPPPDLEVHEDVRIFGGMARDGGGVIIIGGRVVPVPPWDPSVRLLEHLAAYHEGANVDSRYRTPLQRSALESAAKEIDTLIARTEPCTLMLGTLPPLPTRSGTSLVSNVRQVSARLAESEAEKGRLRGTLRRAKRWWTAAMIAAVGLGAGVALLLQSL